MRVGDKDRFERYALIHRAPMHVPIHKFYELPFLVWRPLRECVDVARIKTKAGSFVETLRRARITMSLEVVGGAIQLTAEARDRSNYQRCTDDLILLRTYMRIPESMRDELALRADIYASLRRDMVYQLETVSGLPFAEAICNIVRWEETERKDLHDPWASWPGDTYLIIDAVIRKEARWPLVSTL
jgi:hypothetical protein